MYKLFYLLISSAALAQSVERESHNLEVVSSSLTSRIFIMKICKPHISIPFCMPASTRIIDSELHPVHPWVLILEEDRSIYLWDYSLKSILLSFSSKDLDEKDPGGSLKAVKFLDPHVLRWKWLKSQDLFAKAFQGKGRKKYWVLIVMEHKILFVDYRTGEKKWVQSNAFESKLISCIEFVDSSYLAIGFTDGSIRLFDLEDWEVVKLFPRGTHTKQITQLLSYSKNLSQRSLLISVSGEGVIAVWNVDTCCEIPAFLLQSGSSSAHSGLIYSISLNIETSQLFIIGSDGNLTIWNIVNATLVHKYKNFKGPAKKKILSGCYFNHPVLSPTTVLIHTGNQTISYFESHMFSYPKDSQSIQTLTDLPICKLINIKVHPLQPYLIIATSEEGVYTVYYEEFLVQPFAFSQIFMSSVKPTNSSRESHFLYYYAKDYLCSLIFAVQPEVTVQYCQLLARPIGNKVQVKVSPSGKYLSVLSLNTGLFDIYSVDLNPTKTPDRLKSGYTTHLVWDYSTDRLACICPLNEDDTPGSFASAYSKLLLVVYEINSGKVCLIYRGDSMAKPSSLFGGRALGVTEDPNSFTVFYSWESLKPISSPIPKPTEVYWTESSCVISYELDFYVYKYKDQLEFVYKVNQSIRTAVWVYSVFFYSTRTDIFWLVPCLDTAFLIASHGEDNEEDVEFDLKEDKICERVRRKPHEYCSVVGVFQGNLIIFTAGFKIFNIEIRSNFLRFCLLVTSGIVNEAMALTVKMQDNLHKSASKVLEFMGFTEQALDLSGISYWTAVKLAVKHRIPIELVSFI